MSNNYNHIKYLNVVTEHDMKRVQEDGAGYWRSLRLDWEAIESAVASQSYDIFKVDVRGLLGAFRREMLMLEVRARIKDHSMVRAANTTYTPPEVARVCQEVLIKDVQVVTEKDKEYGASWKRRGGQGAFMMLARKWDRLAEQVSRHNGDIDTALFVDKREEGIRDDIGDLRRYLMLVEAELKARENNDLA